MKDKIQIQRKLMSALAIAAVLAFISTSTWGDDRHQLFKYDSRSNDELVGWHDLYWRWLYGDVTISPDQNGNAVVFNTVLMRLPNVPGDGTAGSIDITLKAGQSFFLPLIGALGTSYTDGTPPDPFVNIGAFKNMRLKLRIDGRTVLDQDDVLDVYAQSYFNTPIPLLPPSPPLDAVIYFQSLGILHKPLSPGRHRITLDEKQTVPEFGYTAEYHNTFIVTVQPRSH